MARITVEDCLQKVNNRFTLIHMAAKRVRQLRKGDEPTIESKNKDIVVSLREVAAGHVHQADPESLKDLADTLLDAPKDLSENDVATEASDEDSSEGENTEGI